MDLNITGHIDKHENKEFPPNIGSIVIIQHNNYEDNLFIGIVYKYLWNKKGCFVILLNNKDYTEPVFIDKKVVYNSLSAKGSILLVPSLGWKYVNIQKLSKILNISIEQINSHISNTKNKFDSSIIINEYPVSQLELTTTGLYHKLNNNNNKDQPCDFQDDFQDESLLSKKGDLILDNLLTEKDIINSLYNKDDEFTTVPTDVQLMLKQKLRLAERINDNEMKIIINKNIAVRNIIDTKEDEINEGEKIIKWIQNNMINAKTDELNIFGDLKLVIHNGYIHIARKGINVEDVITPKLVGNLNYFKWQNDIPIDYDTLKYILFQNDFQKKLKHDISQRKEMEKILSQEYLLCIQPEPKYFMFCVKRLIMAWYSDDLLTQNIRKIKILINQWRAKPDESFNKKYGILPMIVIYPKYGKNSARICLTKIADYFVLYNNVAWSCSQPSYCIKVNDLTYYTNGHLDLKLYYKQTLKEHHGNVINDSFNKDLHKIMDAENLLYPYESNESNK